MNNFAKYMARFLGIMVLLTMTGMGNAVAQDKGAAPKADAPKKGEPVNKVLVDNEQVKAYEATFKPGDVSPSRERKSRIVHYFTSGTLQRTNPDGKTENRVFKAGDTIWIETGTFAVKNTGKTTVRLLVVEPKSK